MNTYSKYRGVWYSRETKKWRAVIRHNGRRIQVGYFADEVEAAKAYDQAAKRYNGEFAATNFKDAQSQEL
jgi:hypothetical protein